MREHEMLRQETLVLKDALDLFQKPGGYTESSYFFNKASGSIQVLTEGRLVTGACAIGGVENALFKLTHERIHDNERAAFAQTMRPYDPVGEKAHVVVYARVMKRLNDIAWERHCLGTVESVTIENDHREGRRKTIRIFQIALAETRRLARNARRREA